MGHNCFVGAANDVDDVYLSLVLCIRYSAAMSFGKMW